MIEALRLTKRYGGRVAVDDLSFTVPPGRITGFLGPNGAGKSTTMQLMLGLVGGGGRTLFDGRPYQALACPPRAVGAMLEGRSCHPSRTVRDHLRMLAAAAAVPGRRVDQVIDQVGLASSSGSRAGGLSLGMGQRLGLAAALLPEPWSLLLDEPANGLDPQGVAWLRELLRAYAASGRAVLVSSHLLGEMQLLADHVVVISQGRLLADEPMERFVRHGVRHRVLVRSPDAARLAELLTAAGAAVERGDDGELAVAGASAKAIGELAHAHRLRLHQLAPAPASLEAAFLELTGPAAEQVSGRATASSGRP